jgi:hypothetical protein
MGSALSEENRPLVRIEVTRACAGIEAELEGEAP